MRLLITAHAASQIEEIDEWWGGNRNDPTGFREEVARAIELLKAAPEQGPPYSPKEGLGCRRILLRKSQHYLYYSYDRRRDLIRILAVWSCYRGAPPPLPGDRRRR